MSDFKYYVYVSETKVEMLYSQIPLSMKDKLEANLKLNLRLAEISFAKKQMPDNAYTKLNVVIEYLKKAAMIGSLGKPLDYFCGDLFLGMAQIYPGVAFWGGKYNDIAIGLGGSMNNLLGYKWDISDAKRGYSHTPWLVALLSKEIEMLIPFDPKHPLLYGAPLGGVSGWEERETDAAASWIHDITTNPSDFHVSKVEFIAKTIKRSELGGHDVLLGTPIYVALSN